MLFREQHLITWNSFEFYLCAHISATTPLADVFPCLAVTNISFWFKMLWVFFLLSYNISPLTGEYHLNCDFLTVLVRWWCLLSRSVWSMVCMFWLPAAGGGRWSSGSGGAGQQCLERRLDPLAEHHEKWPQISFYIHCWEEHGILWEGESTELQTSLGI